MISVYQALSEAEIQNKAVALCIIIRSQGSTPRHTTSKMLVYPDASIVGTVGGGEVETRVVNEAVQAIRDGKPRLLNYQMVNPEQGDPGICGGQVEVFVDPIQPKPILLVIGTGHVGKAVIHLGRWLGFYVVASDDRMGFCEPQVLPDVHACYTCPIEEIPQYVEITPWTYIVLTTRGSDVDVDGLPALLNTPAAYIGVIGSLRRWKSACRDLLAKGISKELLNRVHSPIGLELNAETPEEIAVSILAEIIMVRYGGDGMSMGKK